MTAARPETPTAAAPGGITPDGSERRAGGAEADATVFRRLFDVYARRLRRYATKLLRSPAAADDVVQEVFWRLWQRRNLIRVGETTGSYLFAAARSHALDQLKRERRAECRDAEYAVPQLVDDDPQTPGSASALDADAIGRAFRQVLEGMPTRQRQVVALRFGEELSTADIARRLGISPETAKVHLARATRTLRNRLPGLLSQKV